MDIKLKAETLALILLLIAFPIISLGTSSGNAVVWWLGFAAFVLGGLVPIATRFMDHSTDKPRDMGMEFDDRTS